jgi:hypothetical protein
MGYASTLAVAPSEPCAMGWHGGGATAMGDERARQKRLERKKRRREERRRALKEAVAPPVSIPSDTRVLATDGRAEPLPAGVESWPIVHAYVPARNVWEATGLGTAGVIRQQPDGRCSSAFFVIGLLEHGLRMAFGDRDKTLAEIEESLVRLRDNFPFCEEGPVELAASFAWGARALSEAEGYFFPERDPAQVGPGLGFGGGGGLEDLHRLRGEAVAIEPGPEPDLHLGRGIGGREGRVDAPGVLLAIHLQVEVDQIARRLPVARVVLQPLLEGLLPRGAERLERRLVPPLDPSHLCQLPQAGRAKTSAARIRRLARGPPRRGPHPVQASRHLGGGDCSYAAPYRAMCSSSGRLRLRNGIVIYSRTRTGRVSMSIHASRGLLQRRERP